MENEKPKENESPLDMQNEKPGVWSTTQFRDSAALVFISSLTTSLYISKRKRILFLFLFFFCK